MEISSLRATMSKFLFIVNFLNLPQGDILTTTDKHFNLSKLVRVKLAKDPVWQEGTLLYLGRGYGFISVQDGQLYWQPGGWIQARAPQNGALPEALSK